MPHEQQFMLYKQSPSGALTATGVLPGSREEIIQQAKDLRKGHLVDPAVKFVVQQLNPIPWEQFNG